MAGKKEKLVFIGGRDRGFECLKALKKLGVNIAYIFCMKEEDHEYEKYYDKIELFAKKGKIPIKITNSVKNQEDIALIKSLKPALILVMGWRTLIPKEILEAPVYGAVAVHESLLPHYRGFSPINWAVINGETEVGVSMFFMGEGMDTGDIVAQKVIQVGVSDTAYEIYQKTKKASIQLTIENLESLLSGSAPRVPQDENNANFTCTRNPEDGLIDWNSGFMTIHNLVRALSFPYPGAFTTYEGRRLFIQKASPTPNPRHFIGAIPGRPVARGNGWVEVLTGDSGILRIEKVQEEGGEIVDASLVIRSIRVSLGK